MRKRHIPVSICVLFFLFASVLSAAERVDLESAKRAALHEGKLVFDNDLEVIDHQLMYWPWGEPAVYVFTMIEKGSDFAQNIMFDPEFQRGVSLYKAGNELEGLALLSQSNKYKTMVIGATTDMQPMIKAYAGLPEHMLTLAVMEDPPPDPMWIYAGLFHSLLCSKQDMGQEGGMATEIHLDLKVPIKELGKEKSETIPPEYEYSEWGPFLYPGTVKVPQRFQELDSAIIKPGTHILPVEEQNITLGWQGCSPAAFYNTLKHLIKQRKVYPQGKTNFELLEWISVAMRTKPFKKDVGADGTKPGYTKVGNVAPGAKLVIQGLGYAVKVKASQRKKMSHLKFLKLHARDINAGWTTNLGGAEATDNKKNIFRGHLCCGIGYKLTGNECYLIFHDGWKSTVSYVSRKYYPQGPANQYPSYLFRYRSGGRKNFSQAVPYLPNDPPDLLEPNMKKQEWQLKYKIRSKNNVKVQCWAHEMKFYDMNNQQYGKSTPKTRIHPYKKNFAGGKSISEYKRGKVEITFYLIDAFGHLIKFKTTTKLQHILGTWSLNYRWDIGASGTVVRKIFKTGKFTSGDTIKGTWTLDEKAVKFTYVTSAKPIYSGHVSNDKYNYMNGTMRTTVRDSNGDLHSGTWSCQKKSESYEGSIEEKGIKKDNSDGVFIDSDVSKKKKETDKIIPKGSKP